MQDATSIFALPDAIPQPPKLDEIPSHILHTGTVETLIGQNDDLMARLKVNIRRNAILEQQILEFERTEADFKRMCESLRSQLQILEGKEGFWKTKSLQLEERIDILSHEQRVSSIKQQRLARLEGFRRRTHSWVRGFIARLQQEASIAKKERMQALETLSDREKLIEQLRHRISDQVEHIQNQNKQMQKDQAQLVQRYETGMKKLKEDNEKLSHDYKYHFDRSQRLEELTQLRTEAENQIVLLERSKHEQDKTSAMHIRDLESEVQKSRLNAKMLTSQFSEAQEKLQFQTTELVQLRDQNKTMSEQLDSLQILWSETQKSQEQTKLRLQSLQQLNEELSRKLTDSRRAKIHEVTIDSGAASPKSQQTRAADLLSAVPAPLKEKLNRIDLMLAELESGFTASDEAKSEARSSSINRIHYLDITESDKNSR